MNQIYKDKTELNFIYNGKSAEKTLFLNSTETTLIQFDLTKENNSDFYAEKIKLMRSFKRFKIADYFRQLLWCYINLVKFKREIIIYRNKVDVLSELIQKEKKMELTVRKKSFYL